MSSQGIHLSIRAPLVCRKPHCCNSPHCRKAYNATFCSTSTSHYVLPDTPRPTPRAAGRAIPLVLPACRCATRPLPQIIDCCINNREPLRDNPPNYRNNVVRWHVTIFVMVHRFRPTVLSRAAHPCSSPVPPLFRLLSRQRIFRACGPRHDSRLPPHMRFPHGHTHSTHQDGGRAHARPEGSSVQRLMASRFFPVASGFRMPSTREGEKKGPDLLAPPFHSAQR